MKVLFVCSGNSDFFDKAPFIEDQGESIRKKGIDVDFFLIIGKGFFGYLRNIGRLRKHLKKNKYDIIHAHYALSGLVVILALPKAPIIVSYMGSDVLGNKKEIGIKKVRDYVNILSTQVTQFFADRIIVKSSGLASRIRNKKITSVIPNGVDLQKFRPIPRESAREQTDIDKTKKVVLFLGDTRDRKKNVSLLKNAFDQLDLENVELLMPFPISHEKVSLYMNASDVLVLSSFGEGSPNIVKEAMACDIPVVATDVGDLRSLFGDTPGYFVSSFDAADMAKKIKLAFEMSDRPRGRKRIVSLGLDSDTVAGKITSIYDSLI